MAEMFRASKMTHSGHDPRFHPLRIWKAQFSNRTPFDRINSKAGIQLGSFGARKGDKR
jgi:hypothetical protein